MVAGCCPVASAKVYALALAISFFGVMCTNMFYVTTVMGFNEEAEKLDDVDVIKNDANMVLLVWVCATACVTVWGTVKEKDWFGQSPNYPSHPTQSAQRC